MLITMEALEWFSVETRIIMFTLHMLKTYLVYSVENGIKGARLL